jgi:hypothetical protein
MASQTTINSREAKQKIADLIRGMVEKDRQIENLRKTIKRIRAKAKEAPR